MKMKRARSGGSILLYVNGKSSTWHNDLIERLTKKDLR